MNKNAVEYKCEVLPAECAASTQKISGSDTVSVTQLERYINSAVLHTGTVVYPKRPLLIEKHEIVFTQPGISNNRIVYNGVVGAIVQSISSKLTEHVLISNSFMLPKKRLNSSKNYSTFVNVNDCSTKINLSDQQQKVSQLSLTCKFRIADEDCTSLKRQTYLTWKVYYKDVVVHTACIDQSGVHKVSFVELYPFNCYTVSVSLHQNDFIPIRVDGLSITVTSSCGDVNTIILGSVSDIVYFYPNNLPVPVVLYNLNKITIRPGSVSGDWVPVQIAGESNWLFTSIENLSNQPSGPIAPPVFFRIQDAEITNVGFVSDVKSPQQSLMEDVILHEITVPVDASAIHISATLVGIGGLHWWKKLSHNSVLKRNPIQLFSSKSAVVGTTVGYTKDCSAMIDTEIIQSDCTACIICIGILRYSQLKQPLRVLNGLVCVVYPHAPLCKLLPSVSCLELFQGRSFHNNTVRDLQIHILAKNSSFWFAFVKSFQRRSVRSEPLHSVLSSSNSKCKPKCGNWPTLLDTLHSVPCHSGTRESISKEKPLMTLKQRRAALSSHVGPLQRINRHRVKRGLQALNPGVSKREEFRELTEQQIKKQMKLLLGESTTAENYLQMSEMVLKFRLPKNEDLRVAARKYVNQLNRNDDMSASKQKQLTPRPPTISINSSKRPVASWNSSPIIAETNFSHLLLEREPRAEHLPCSPTRVEILQKKLRITI